MFDDLWLLLPPTAAEDPAGTPRAFDPRLARWRDVPTVDPVLRGLAHNPAAPTDVLLGLLDAHGDAVPDAFNRRAALPPVVVEAMLRHPSPRIRAALAVNRYVDPLIRLRLVDDPDHRVVEALGTDPDLALPDRAFARSFDRLVQYLQRAQMTADELHTEAIEAMSRDRRSVPVAARHPEPRVRTAALDALGMLDEATRDAVKQALLRDPAPEVRAAAARYDADLARVHEPADLPRNGYAYRGLLRERRLSRPLIAHVLAIDADDGVGGVSAMAGNRTLPPDVLEALFDHPSPDVRCSLAVRDDLSRAQLRRLAADSDVAVRTAASTHPRLTETERAAIDIDASTSREHRPHGLIEFSNRRDEYPWMRPSTLPPPEQSLRWATSVNALLRRRAAADPRLPADIVAALAQDTDLGVRVLLAQHHPAAPPALLLRSYREYKGGGRARLLAMPNFPTTDLAPLADDPDPAVRRLAARDPLATPALVERLTHDPALKVRRAMAACPRLPLPRIVALLDDPDLAEPAAANPALPADIMRQRLTTARPTPH
ncbi:hypothetical protein [Polymorphospora rubra]|uniref:hypothetical protein n=1 Tax=Polymorphospora rubra TaxID=338584 RepID=UPI003404D581